MNPWAQFKSKSFNIIDLGKAAVFYIPVKKLRGKKGIRIRQDLYLFLVAQFGANSVAVTPTELRLGQWRNDSGLTIIDKCVDFEISFAGKEKILPLMERLTKLAQEINEECIYFKAGEDSCLIVPKKVRRA